MITYDLMLEKQRLVGADRFSLAANANETLCLRFHFDRNWRCFDSKAAVFRNLKQQYYIIEVVANRVSIPWEVLTEEGEFELAVIGFDGTKVITSDKVNIIVKESLLPEEYKTFSPSEVIFDRFREECFNQAYLEFRDEIAQLKSDHAKEKLQLGEEIVAANERTQEAIRMKNEEIAVLNTAHDKTVKEFSDRISDLESTLDEVQPKADYWDMVDYAVSTMKLPNQALWAGGTQPYSLPMLDTSSITAFSTNSFSTNLREVGIDVTSVTSFASVFSSKNGIERITLKNTHNVTTFASAFEICKSVREITLGYLDSCISLARFANEAALLEKVKFRKTVRVQDYSRAFCNCQVLKEIDGEFNMETATDVANMFTGCSSLETVTFKEDTIRKSLSFSSCINLSKDSMLNIIGGLSDEVTGTLSLSLHAFDKNFPTDGEQNEIFEIMTEVKGWILSLS